MGKYQKGCSVAETADVLDKEIRQSLSRFMRYFGRTHRIVNVQKICQSLLKKNTQDSLT